MTARSVYRSEFGMAGGGPVRTTRHNSAGANDWLTKAQSLMHGVMSNRDDMSRFLACLKDAAYYFNEQVRLQPTTLLSPTSSPNSALKGGGANAAVPGLNPNADPNLVHLNDTCQRALLFFSRPNAIAEQKAISYVFSEYVELNRKFFLLEAAEKQSTADTMAKSQAGGASASSSSSSSSLFGSPLAALSKMASKITGSAINSNSSGSGYDDRPSSPLSPFAPPSKAVEAAVQTIMAGTDKGTVIHVVRIRQQVFEIGARHCAAQSIGWGLLSICAQFGDDDPKVMDYLLAASVGPSINEAKAAQNAVHAAKEVAKRHAKAQALGFECGAALRAAAGEGHGRIVNFLLNKGTKVNAQDSYGRTALLMAARFGKADIVGSLIDSKSDLDAQDFDGQTALSVASAFGFAAVVQLLVSHSADINTPNPSGNTPIFSAAAAGRHEVVQAFFRAAGLGGLVTQANSAGETLLMLAARSGFEDVVQDLLRNNASLDLADIKGQTALYGAAEMGHYSIAKLLLDARADVDGRASGSAVPPATPNSASSASRGSFSGVTALSLLGGASAGGVGGVDGSPVNANNGTRSPIGAAAFMRNTDVVQLLLERKADINAVDGSEMNEGRGAPALVRCAERGNIAMVRLLLAAKADPVAKRKSDNKSALAAAFDSYQRGMVVTLASAMKIDLAEITASARMKNLAGVMPFHAGKEYNVVVLGTSDAGKTTMCLQAELLYSHQTVLESEPELASKFSRPILENTIHFLNALVALCDKHKIALNTKLLALKEMVLDHGARRLQMYQSQKRGTTPSASPVPTRTASPSPALTMASLAGLTGGAATPLPFTDTQLAQFISAVRMLYHSAPLQEALLFHRSEIQPSYDLVPLLNKIDEVGSRNYVPSISDVIQGSSQPTTEIVDYHFHFLDAKFHLYDTGGSRPQRPKWGPVYQDAQAILFVVAVSEYDEVCGDDSFENRLTESFSVFQTVRAQALLKDVPMWLLFNKIDLFAEKIARVDLKVCFGDYTGGCDFEKALAFIEKKFRTGDPRPSAPLHVMRTCAVDSSKIVQQLDSLWNELGKTMPVHRIMSPSEGNKTGPRTRNEKVQVKSSEERFQLIRRGTVYLDMTKEEVKRRSGESIKEQLADEEAEGRAQLADFTMIATIGRGAFAEVRLCRKKSNGQVYAIKIMRKSEMMEKGQLYNIRCERNFLILADSPWTVQLHFSFQDEKNLYLVMEFIPGGDFATLLQKLDVLSEDQARFYVAELASSIYAVHSRKYMHRDLKPENILLGKDGHLKLSDFGCCKSMLDASSDSTPIVGTPDYMAPEVIERSGYGYECDWWSLGVIMFEFIIGYPPFYAQDVVEVCRKILNWSHTLTFPDDKPISDDAKDLIGKLLCERRNRLTFSELKKHPFFKDLDWDNLRKIDAAIIPKVTDDADTQNFDKFDEDEGDKAAAEAPIQAEQVDEYATILDFAFSRDEDDKRR